MKLAVFGALVCSLVLASSNPVTDPSPAVEDSATNTTVLDIVTRISLRPLPEVNVIKVVTDPDVCVCDGPYAFGGCIRGISPLQGFFGRSEVSEVSEPEVTPTKSKKDEDSSTAEKTEDEAMTTTQVPLQSETKVAEQVPENDVFVTGRANCKCGVASGSGNWAKLPNPVPFTCNLPTNGTKIVGGSPTTIKRYPWTVALVRSGSGRPFCGGTLINDQYVITANHCVDGQQPGRIMVYIYQERFPSNSQQNLFPVSEIKMHSGYNRQNIDNDIALLRLSKRVPLGHGNGPIPACLPASDQNDFAGLTATVTGWGATSEGGPLSPVIREVDVKILSHDRCNGDTNYKGRITRNMLCAGYDEGGRDSCQGDSGGPLIIGNGGRSTLVGVVSWGHGCARPKSPGVYARVSRYAQWILQNTKGADWCDG